MDTKPTYDELELKVKELEENERKYRHLFETAMVGIYRTRVDDGKFLAANQTLAKLMGYDSVDQLIAEYVTSKHYTDPNRREELLRQIQTQGRVDGFEIEMTRKNGSIVQIAISAAAYPERGYLEGVVIDITARKQAEKALRESEEKFRNVFMSAPVGIAIARPEGSFIEVNNIICRMLGYSEDELREMTFLDITFPDDRSETQRQVREVWDDKSDFYHLEKCYLRKDGSPVWARVSAIAVRDSSGKVQHWVGIMEDITERKRTEEERIRLATVVEQVAESVIISDRPGRIQYVNPAFELLSGFSWEEIVGQNFRILKSDRHDDSFYKKMWDIISRGDVWQGHIINTMKDGKLCEFETTISPIRDSSGAIVNFVSVNRDVTREVALQAQLQQAQKMEAIGTLAGGIAHDFNNLLMGIQGRTSLMLMDIDSFHPHFEHLIGIEKYVHSAADLTRQLLAYARGGKYEVKPIDLNKLIHKFTEMFGRTKKEIDIKKKIQKDIWTVEVDQSQIEQVLLNLYVNAWQSMPVGGELYIETENFILDKEYTKPYSIKPGKYVKVSITDTGIGMDKATQERIFEPFFTTKELGRGTGLGLASAYGIIKNHGGYIDVYSEKNKGSTFTICLPASEKEVIPEKKFIHDVSKGTETILLVDDEDLIVDVGKQMLEKIGYKVLIARSGKEAIEFYDANKNEIDLVILDLIMPGMSGGDTYDKLKEIDPDVKALLSSGYSIDGQASEILSRGCNGFIQKPFNIRDLSQKIEKILNFRNAP